MTMHHIGSWVVRAWAVAGLVAAALFSTAPASRADDPIDRVSLTGQVGMTGLAMGQVNDQIDAGNEFLAFRGWSRLDHISYGFNFNWNLHARLFGPVGVGVGGGRVIGKTSLDFDEVISVEPTVDFYQARVDYLLPFRPIPNLMLRLAGGPVWFRSIELKARHERRDVEAGIRRVETATFNGDTWGAHGFLEGELVLSEKVTFVADFGYRVASTQQKDWNWKITGLELPLADDDRDGIINQYDFDEENSWLIHSFLEVQKDDEGRVLVDNDGRPIVDINRPSKNLEIDLSGVIANVGLRFYLF